MKARRYAIFAIFSVLLISMLPIVSAKEYKTIETKYEIAERNADELVDMSNKSQSNYNLTWQPFIDEFDIKGSISSAMLPPSKVTYNQSGYEDEVRMAIQYASFDSSTIMEGSSIQWWRAPFNRKDGEDIDIQMDIYRTDSIRMFEMDNYGYGVDNFVDLKEDWVTNADKVFSREYNLNGANKTTAKMQNIHWENKSMSYNFTYLRSYCPIYSGEDYAIVWQWEQNSDREEMFLTQSNAGSNDYYHSEIALNENVSLELECNLLTDTLHQYGQSSKIAGDNVKANTNVSFSTELNENLFFNNVREHKMEFNFWYENPDTENISLNMTYVDNGNMRTENLGEVDWSSDPSDWIDAEWGWFPLGVIDSGGNISTNHTDICYYSVETDKSGSWAESDFLEVRRSEGLVKVNTDGNDYNLVDLMEDNYRVVYNIGDTNSFDFTLPFHSESEVEINIDFTFYNGAEEKDKVSVSEETVGFFFYSVLSSDILEEGEEVDNIYVEFNFNETAGLWLEDRNDMEENYTYTVSELTSVEDDTELEIGYVPFHTAQTHGYRIVNEKPPNLALPFFMPAKQYEIKSYTQKTTLELLWESYKLIIEVNWNLLKKAVEENLQKISDAILSNPTVGKFLDKMSPVIDFIKDVAEKLEHVASFLKDKIEFLVNNWEWVVFSFLRVTAMISSAGMFFCTVWLIKKWTNYWYVMATKSIGEANMFMIKSAKSVLSMLTLIAIGIFNMLQIIAGPLL